MSFRNSASFGKRIEYWIVGLLLKEKYDVFIPLVDDDAVDAILRGKDGKIVELQIKARSNEVVFGDAALFAAIVHAETRNNYFFIFYSERMESIWVMSSNDFIAHAVQNKSGKNIGKRSIWLNGRNTKNQTEHGHDRFEKWCITKNGIHDFSQFKEIL
ncbi:MAG: hypothetical protein PSY14_15895 [bacterium]|nr:hypothetical protein [bacterium]